MKGRRTLQALPSKQEELLTSFLKTKSSQSAMHPEAFKEFLLEDRVRLDQQNVQHLVKHRAMLDGMVSSIEDMASSLERFDTWWKGVSDPIRQLSDMTDRVEAQSSANRVRAANQEALHDRVVGILEATSPPPYVTREFIASTSLTSETGMDEMIRAAEEVLAAQQACTDKLLHITAVQDQYGSVQGLAEEYGKRLVNFLGSNVEGLAGSLRRQNNFTDRSGLFNALVPYDVMVTYLAAIHEPSHKRLTRQTVGALKGLAVSELKPHITRVGDAIKQIRGTHPTPQTTDGPPRPRPDQAVGATADLIICGTAPMPTHDLQRFNAALSALLGSITTHLVQDAPFAHTWLLDTFAPEAFPVPIPEGVTRAVRAQLEVYIEAIGDPIVARLLGGEPTLDIVLTAAAEVEGIVDRVTTALDNTTTPTPAADLTRDTADLLTSYISSPLAEWVDGWLEGELTALEAAIDAAPVKQCGVAPPVARAAELLSILSVIPPSVLLASVLKEVSAKTAAWITSVAATNAKYRDIFTMENSHHVAAAIRCPDAGRGGDSSLMTFEAMYKASMSRYTHWIFSEALPRLSGFVEVLKTQVASTSTADRGMLSEIQLTRATSKQAFGKVKKRYTKQSNALGKAVDALIKRLTKHLSPEEALFSDCYKTVSALIIDEYKSFIEMVGPIYGTSELGPMLTVADVSFTLSSAQNRVAR